MNKLHNYWFEYEYIGITIEFQIWRNALRTQKHKNEKFISQKDSKWKEE